MTSFQPIYDLAVQRKGGEAQLHSLLPKVLSSKELASKGDDRYLAMMCKTINQAGFNWNVIENKWPQFEDAFHGFDVQRLAFKPPEEWEAYMHDTRVVRNWNNIKAMMHNASFVFFTGQEHGSFAQFMADWPPSDQVGLMLYLKKHASRLGGNSGFWFLRHVGKDCFTTTHDVIQAVKQAGYETADHPKSKRDLTQVQNAFNHWHEETGLPYSHLSRIAACSTGTNHPTDQLQQRLNRFKAGSSSTTQ